MKRRKKRVRINPYKAVLIVVGILLLMVTAVSVKNIFSLRSEQQELIKNNKKLIAEKKALTEELKNVNDYDYIEEQARIQLKLVKPGEILYILDDGEKKKKETGN